MKITVNMSAAEALEKIQKRISGKFPRIYIQWYVKNEFLGEVKGNKFQIQKTRSRLANYLYARVFYGVVNDISDGQAEIEGKFQMNPIFLGQAAIFLIAAAFAIFINLFYGKNALETAILLSIYLLFSVLIIRLLSLAFKKEEAEVIEFLESLQK